MSEPGLGNPVPSGSQNSRLPLPAAMRPYLYGVGAILCWASLAAAVGESLQRVAPEQILFHGLLVAGAGLSIKDWMRHRRIVPPWPGTRSVLIGVYGIWGYHTLLLAAFSLAPVMEANILNYTWPLWIVLLSSLLPGHRRSWQIVMAGLVGFAGVVLVFSGGDPTAISLAGRGVQAWTGLALALGAGFCWGSFTVLIRRVIPAGQENMALFCLLSAALAGIAALAGGVPLTMPLDDYWLPLFIGLVPWGLAFFLWERAVQQCNLQVLGLLTFFTPPLSTLLLALVSGSPAGWHHLAGLALILSGAAWGGRRAWAEAEAKG